jgi:hypothetical protein
MPSSDPGIDQSSETTTPMTTDPTESTSAAGDSSAPVGVGGDPVGPFGVGGDPAGPFGGNPDTDFGWSATVGPVG